MVPAAAMACGYLPLCVVSARVTGYCLRCNWEWPDAARFGAWRQRKDLLPELSVEYGCCTRIMSSACFRSI